MIWAFVFWLNVWPFMELYEFTGGHEKNSCQAYETHLIGKKTIRFFTNLQNTQPQAIHYNTLWQLRKKNSEKYNIGYCDWFNLHKNEMIRIPEFFRTDLGRRFRAICFNPRLHSSNRAPNFSLKVCANFFFVECCGKKFLLRT